MPFLKMYLKKIQLLNTSEIWLLAMERTSWLELLSGSLIRQIITLVSEFQRNFPTSLQRMRRKFSVINI